MRYVLKCDKCQSIKEYIIYRQSDILRVDFICDYCKEHTRKLYQTNEYNGENKILKWLKSPNATEHEVKTAIQRHGQNVVWFLIHRDNHTDITRNKFKNLYFLAGGITPKIEKGTKTAIKI